ncbi:hypothetical protein K490DRAFT_65048 [Saccharata proteae CBS 121410]|uniref:Transcription initiation factor IIF subunit beta n=1 Tax=Saccharata proteae CBS 121410 TaxID=1314787 RepID=A0A9P4HZF6_9PEZI|nr:hypothetical protein K490DRAFT_65048 [Saccharata proteae CBS 121410]
MTANGMKMEYEPQIKPDPEVGSPGGYMDDDVYEDTGELTIPGDFGSSPMWLTRVPKWLWTVLNKIEDDDEIELGKMQMWEENGQRKHKLNLHKNSYFEALPKEYEVHMIHPTDVSNNTFVFSEKDLEGYQTNAYRRNRHNMPPNRNTTEGGRIDKSQRRGKKPIPKNTALAAKSSLEINAFPVENAELAAYRAGQLRKAERATSKLHIEEDFNRLNQLYNKATTTAFEGIPMAGHNAAAKAKNQDNKYARIPENELMDMLSRLFREYRYWSMKSLKERTKQPEQYLRETLSKIAVLIRAGPFANHWTLETGTDLSGVDFEALANMKDEAAPQGPGGSDDDDDEDEEMEDVV